MMCARSLLTTSAVLCSTLLTACASLTPPQVADPKDITISEAMKEIGAGFAAMDNELESRVLGLYPCKVKVTLNVKASAKDAGKLVLDLSTKPRVLEGLETPADPAAKARLEKSGEAAAERGNTVDIEMYNPGCLPKDTLGYAKPKEIGNARDGMAFTEGQMETINNLMSSESLMIDD